VAMARGRARPNARGSGLPRRRLERQRVEVGRQPERAGNILALERLAELLGNADRRVVAALDQRDQAAEAELLQRPVPRRRCALGRVAATPMPAGERPPDRGIAPSTWAPRQPVLSAPGTPDREAA